MDPEFPDDNAMRSVRGIWATYSATRTAEEPGPVLDTVNELLKYDDSVIIACLHEVLSPGPGGGRPPILKVTGFLDAAHDLTDRWTSWVVGLFPDLSRWLGPDVFGYRARKVLEQVPSERLRPLAHTLTTETLDDAEYEDICTYWGLFDMLQAVGFHDLARLVAQAAAESMVDEDLPGAGRDWLQELEDGIERR